MTKILISVLSTLHYPWKNLDEHIRKTWGRTEEENIQIIYYYGNSPNNETLYIEKDKSLFLDLDENFKNINRKTVEMYDFCLKHFDFDYMFRTNASSYVIQNELKKYLEDKPKSNFVSAVIGDHEGLLFPSGSGYSISKDVLQKIVENKEIMNSFKIMDDVWLGKILQQMNISITPAPRKDYQYEKDAQLIPGIFHYRCKTFLTHDRNEDTKIFDKLYNASNFS